MIDSHIFIGPPGAGKTTLQKKFPGRFIDPEESINWPRADAQHGLYLQKTRRVDPSIILEHELDWPTVWIEEVLPRIWGGLMLNKDIVMGLITPSNVEIVHRFLSAFQKQTTLILPDEQQHFLQTWQQEHRRPRTWGTQLMGWQNTFWIRLLLEGLATDLKLKVVKQPKISKHKTQARIQGSDMREARNTQGTKFVEVFHGRWAQLDAQEGIVAMYRSSLDNNDNIKHASGILLTCDQTARVCGKGMHQCHEPVLLKTDINGHDLRRWIAHDKIVRPTLKQKKTNKNAVIFFAGTLAPFHHGHLDALDAAKAHLESQGWNVIGGYASTFLNLKENRVSTLDPILGPAERRTTMIQLGTAFSKWLMADFPTQHVLDASLLARKQHPTQEVASRLRERQVIESDTPITTFWINGKDAYLDPHFFSAFADYADRDSLNPLRMLIIDNRPGENIWSHACLSVAVPALVPFVLRHTYHSKKPASATAVREALKTADRLALRETVGLPLVEAYLMGLMHKSTRQTTHN